MLEVFAQMSMDSIFVTWLSLRGIPDGCVAVPRAAGEEEMVLGSLDGYQPKERREES